MSKNYGKLNIIPADEPRKLLFGWECSDTGKKWLIRIADMKLWISSRPYDEQETYMKAVMTKKGRLDLAVTLSSPPIEENI